MREESGDGGGAPEEGGRVAPVIPLFGASSPSERHPARRANLREEDDRHSPRPRLRALRPIVDDTVAPSAADGVVFSEAGDSTFGEADALVRRATNGVAFVDPDAGVFPGREGRVSRGVTDSASRTADDSDSRKRAQQLLLRKLRGKALSVREARLVLHGVGVDDTTADAIIDEFLERGYLNDTVLAELFVRAGSERRALGRTSLARSLAQRGIDRAVIDEALSALPDDDADRALEYARSKMRGMANLDREVALRRLVGQLTRRGYGAEALAAARTALDELAQPRGVHFR